MNRILPCVFVLLACGCALGERAPLPAPVHLANGIKIGEVTQRSALVWMRLTRDAEANHAGAPFARVAANQPQLPAGLGLEAMAGAAPGAAGEVRITLRSASDQRQTDWLAVDPAADFTRKVAFDELAPGQSYRLVVEGRAPGSTLPSCRVEGRFQTALAADAQADVGFCVITGQDYARRDDRQNGHRIYAQMLGLEPQFLVHTGDTLYYDKAGPFATSVELARFKWNRFYGLSLPREFHRQVSCYFLKDDHDTLKNDCWPGQSYHDLSWEQGLAIYREQLPVGDPPYRRVRWGRDLELWFVAGREFRSPNRMADGPDKTIWGAEQKAWLMRTMRASDATFRVLVSPTPIVGPDRGNKNDNHANRGFRHEGDEVRRFLASLANAIVLCGDRHWQYVSRDVETGLREFSCGPTSDAHAGGFDESKRGPEHEFLRVKGGFLYLRCERGADGARLVLQHRDTAGAVQNEVRLRGR